MEKGPPAKSGFGPQTASDKVYVLDVSQVLGPLESCPSLARRRSTRSFNGRRIARPMGRVPLPPQIAFLPCTSQSQDKSKARLLIGREILGHWSMGLLCMILGRLDGPADLAIQYISSEIRSSDGNLNYKISFFFNPPRCPRSVETNFKGR
ncbi:hypothetical protein TNCV_2423051 [Trichonephila clavipes]|nr:hypothetical protein TNCV_2423051 [Trichonephila clavipes]